MITESAKFEQNGSKFKTIIHFVSTIILLLPSKTLFLIHTDDSGNCMKQRICITIYWPKYILIDREFVNVHK